MTFYLTKLNMIKQKPPRTHSFAGPLVFFLFLLKLKVCKSIECKMSFHVHTLCLYPHPLLLLQYHYTQSSWLKASKMFSPSHYWLLLLQARVSISLFRMGIGHYHSVQWYFFLAAQTLHCAVGMYRQQSSYHIQWKWIGHSVLDCLAFGKRTLDVFQELAVLQDEGLLSDSADGRTSPVGRIIQGLPYSWK